MSYFDKIAQQGESALFQGRLHWIIYVGPMIVCTFALIMIAVGSLDYFDSWNAQIPLNAILDFGVVMLLLSLTMVLSAWIRRATTEIVITDRRVIYKIGLIRRRTVEMNISKIETVDVNQSVLGRILGFGTVVVRGTGSTFEPLRGVADALALRGAILIG